MARVARFEWQALECRVEGVLERVAGTSQLARYHTVAHLTVPEGADPVKARELLDRAEHGCLIANSLRGVRSLAVEIITQCAGMNSAASEASEVSAGARQD